MKIAIIISGGLVQEIVQDDPKLHSFDIAVFDADPVPDEATVEVEGIPYAVRDPNVYWNPQRTQDLFAAAAQPSPNDLLSEIVDGWPQFDSGDHVNGADLAEWFGELRERAKRSLGRNSP